MHFASCLDSDTLLDCTECGLSMSAADATTMLCYESIGFPNQIAEIDSDDMHRTGHLHITQNISRRIRSRPPHPFHYKALEVCTWTWQQDLSRFWTWLVLKYPSTAWREEQTPPPRQSVWLQSQRGNYTLSWFQTLFIGRGCSGFINVRLKWRAGVLLRGHGGVMVTWHVNWSWHLSLDRAV